jgi:cell pole-organizing protein PopZ
MSDSTEGKDQHEPSMEEILASIRRIISEDGDGAEGGDAAAAPKAEEEAAAEPEEPAVSPSDAINAALAPPPEAARPKRPPIADVELEAEEHDESDVLLLTEEAIDEPPPRPSVRDSTPAREENEPPPEPYREPEPLTFESEPELEPEPEPVAPRARAPEPAILDDRLISDRAAAASLAAMTELVSRSYREPNIESLSMGNANQTLEDLTRELLRPILKAWLDDNLPQIVERVVREEIGRLALDAQRR